MNKKISVIVPVYNTSKYLKHCLDSLLEQTYRDMEIIVVDDGSTDCSGEICDSYAEMFVSKIVVVHTENHGLSAARNTGMKYATGDYIGFVDSDDWVEKDMFEILLKNISETKSDLSVCSLKYDFGDREVDVERRHQRTVYSHNEIFEQIMNNKNFYGYVCNKLFKRSVIANLIFDEKLLSCEDIVFSVKYAVNCMCAVSTIDALYHYRQHRESMTGELRYNVRKISVLDAYEMLMPIYEVEKPELLYVLYRNYLKININIKGRMCLSDVEDSIIKKRLDKNINFFSPIVLKERRNRISVKMNIFLSKSFPGMMLRLKQFVLKRRYRGN